MMQKSFLVLLVTLASSNATSSNLRRRELWGDSSSSSSSWSFWGSLFQLLDHMHTPCPPGPLHHKDSDGEPLPPGQCWQDLHPPHHHHKKSSSHNVQSSLSSAGGWHSYNITYSFVECQEGDANCYQNILCKDDDADCMEYIMCEDDDQDCQMWIKCDDDSENCMANIQLHGWGDDGYDGWKSNNLDQGSSYASNGVQNGGNTPIWPFLVAAFVAGAIGAMLVVARHKRRKQRIEHPLDGAVKKRQRLFSGLSKKQGALNEDFDDEDDKPKFIEVSERKNSYKSPKCDDSLQGSYLITELPRI